jgi:hypothetical protein
VTIVRLPIPQYCFSNNVLFCDQLELIAAYQGVGLVIPGHTSFAPKSESDRRDECAQCDAEVVENADG